MQLLKTIIVQKVTVFYDNFKTIEQFYNIHLKHKDISLGVDLM